MQEEIPTMAMRERTVRIMMLGSFERPKSGAVGSIAAIERVFLQNFGALMGKFGRQLIYGLQNAAYFKL